MQPARPRLPVDSLQDPFRNGELGHRPEFRHHIFGQTTLRQTRWAAVDVCFDRFRFGLIEIAVDPRFEAVQDVRAVFEIRMLRHDRVPPSTDRGVGGARGEA